MKKVLVVAVYILLFFPMPCYGSSKNTLTLFFSTGEKSQTDGTEERDLSGDFDYRKYGFSSNFKPEKNLTLKLGFQEYVKDFISRTQPDADMYKYNAGLSYKFLEEENHSIGANFDFCLRSKRYDNDDDSEYDQIKLKGSLEYEYEDAFSLEAGSGYEEYDYLTDNSKDSHEVSLEIAPKAYFFDKKLELGGSIEIKWPHAEEEPEDKTVTISCAEAALNLDYDFLNKIKADIQMGTENTQGTEDREDSLDYKYVLWEVATYHKLHERLKTKMQYGQKRRNYLADNNDYENWYIKNKTTLTILEKEPFNLEIFADGEHKETAFDKIHTKSYLKNKIAGGLHLLKRANWSLTPEFGITDYNYVSESTSDQRAYKLDISAKKYIAENVSLEGGYWYNWKDYKYKPDVEQWSINLSCNIKF